MKRLVVCALITLVVFGCGKKKESVTTTTAPPKAEPTQPAPDAGELKIGSAMPSYSGPTLEGSTFDLTKEKGHVVFVNLWATWCGPCRFEIPQLEELHQKYKARGLTVVGVSVDESEPKAVQEFATEQKMTYPVVLDPAGKMAVILQTTILPTSVILDRQGKIVWKKYGPILPNDQSLVRAVEAALAKT